jgi:hypothetical protein
MSLEVTKQELLKQAIYLKKLYETTRVQDYKDQETRIRRIVVELESLVIGTSNVTNLDSLSDVTLSAPANAQVLAYNSTTLQWENQTPAAGGGGDMNKSTYDVDNDGVVDSAETTQIIVRNSTGVTLTKGQVVYLSGATGNRPNAVLSQAHTEATSSKTIGIVVANINNNSDGYVAVSGTLHDLNTSAFTAGDAVWLSATTAGGMTSTIPAEPNHAVFIGYIARAHPTQGRLVIVIQNGYELNELHGVLVTSETNNDLLVYESSTSLWKNKQISSVLSNGMLKVAAAISTTFQSVTDYLGNASVLFLNSRRIGIGKDTSVTTQSVAVVEVQDTNTSIVLKPNGTGAIIASVPDGTATGGNARGTNAVDLQQSRSNSANVASGNYSTIVGGNGCTASGQYSVSGGIGASASNYAGVTFGNSNGNNSYGGVVSGGQNNTGGNADYIFIGGGRFNNTTGAVNGVISGGISNTVSSSYSTVSGGQSNTASTNTHATVVGGQSNTASGIASVSGGGGNTASGAYSVTFGEINTASGQYNTVCGGRNNVANGSQYCTIGGGSGNQCTHFETTIAGGVSNSVNRSGGFIGGGGSNTITASGHGVIGGGYQNLINTGNNVREYITIPGGLQARGFNFAGHYLASGMFATQGDAQQSLLTARNSSALTTGATLVLSLDGTGTTNLIIPSGNNRAWNVTIDTIAVVTAITGTATGVSVGDTYEEKATMSFKRVGGTSSLVALGSREQIYDTSMATAIMNFSAGASQQLQIQFQAPAFAGGGSITCRVVSKVSLVEVAY